MAQLSPDKLQRLQRLQGLLGQVKRLKALKANKAFLDNREATTGYRDVSIPDPNRLTGADRVAKDYIDVTHQGSMLERVLKRGAKEGHKAIEQPDTGYSYLDKALGLAIAPVGVVAGMIGGVYDEIVAPVLGVEKSGERLTRDIMAMTTEQIGSAGGVLGGAKQTLKPLSRSSAKRLEAFNRIEKATHKAIDSSKILSDTEKASLKTRYSNALVRRIKEGTEDYKTLYKRYAKTRKLQGENPIARVKFLGEALDEAGVRLDPHRAEVQFVEAIMSHKLPTEKLVPLVNQSGLKLKDIDNIFKKAVKAKPPVWVAAKNEFGLWNSSIARAQGIARAARVDRATDFAQLTVEANLNKVNGSHFLGRAWATFDQPRRMAMVSQMATAVRNAQVGVGRTALDTMTEMFEAGYTTVLNPLKAPEAWSHIGSTFRWMVQAQTPKARRAMDTMLSAYPVQANRVMQTIMPDLELATGQSKKGVWTFAKSMMMAFNMAQERLFRRGAFMNEASKLLRRKGVNPSQVINNPKAFAASLNEGEIFRSVEHAMDFTFANEPANAVLRDTIRGLNKTPATLAVPFARFLTQSLKFLGEHSTQPVYDILTQGLKGDFTMLPKNLAKLTTGAAVYLAAEQMVNDDLTPFGLKHGDQWNIFIDKDGNRLDVRNYAPLSFPIWLADFRKRAMEGRLPEGAELVSYITDGTLGMQARLEGGLKAVEGIRETLLEFVHASSTKGTGDASARAAGQFTGGIVSQFLTPLRTLDDLYGYFNSTEAIERNRRVDPFFSKALQNIPGDKEIIERLTNNKLEPLVDPFSPDSPVMRESIVLGSAGIQITGIRQGRKLGATVERLNYLGIPAWQYSPYTGFPELDHVISTNLQQLMPFLDNFVTANLPKDLPKDNQWLVLTDQLSKISKVARDAAGGDQKAIEFMQKQGMAPSVAPALDLLYKIHGISKPKLNVIAHNMNSLVGLQKAPKGIPQEAFQAMQQIYIMAKKQGVDLKEPGDYRDFMRSLDRVSRNRQVQ